MLEEIKEVLIKVTKLDPVIMHMMNAFRAELLACDESLKAELNKHYGINLVLYLLTHAHTPRPPNLFYMMLRG
jgi:hypothetical protein